MELQTIVGDTYSVTSQEDCEVYAVLDGGQEMLVKKIRGGQQGVFQAVSKWTKVTEDEVVVLPFEGAGTAIDTVVGPGKPLLVDLADGMELEPGGIYLVRGEIDLRNVCIDNGCTAEIWVLMEEEYTIEWPENWQWLSGNAPDMAAGKNHCVVVRNSLGTIIANEAYTYDRT